MKFLSANLVIADWVQNGADGKKTIHGLLGAVMSPSEPALWMGSWVYLRVMFDGDLDEERFTLRVLEQGLPPVDLGSGGFRRDKASLDMPMLEVATPLPPVELHKFGAFVIEAIDTAGTRIAATALEFRKVETK